MSENTLKLIIQDYYGRELAWSLFLKPANEPAILKEKNPQNYENYLKYIKLKRKHTRTYRKISVSKGSGNDVTINRYFNSWKKLNFLDPIITPQTRAIKRFPLKLYRLNLNPFFTYFKNIGFNEKQKRILDFLLHPKWVRNSLKQEYGEDDLIKAISKFYLNRLLIPFLENDISSAPIINFNKKFLDIFINDSDYRDETLIKKKGKIKFIVSNKTLKIQKIMENNEEEYDMYLNGPINLKGVAPIYFYVSIYNSLYKHYKKEMDNLNIHMLKTLKFI